MRSVSKKTQTGQSGDKFWRDLRDDLSSQSLCESDDGKNGYDSFAGFNLARRVQGHLLNNGFNPFNHDVMKLAPGVEQCVAECCGDVDAEATVEAMVHCWDNIRSPEGYDAVSYTAQKAKTKTKVAPGAYATTRQSELATVIWHLLCSLPEESERVVFVSMRKVGEALDKDHVTIMRAIGSLIRNKVIAVEVKGRQGTSSRYRILMVC